jgi:O-antigen/teichoic acid export membrane protein
MLAYRDLGKLLLGGAAIKLLGIAATLIFVRLLTKEQLAIFPIYLMLRGLADGTLDLGITPYFIRVLPSFLREGRDKTRSLLFTGIPIVYGGLAVATAGTFFFADQIAQLLLADGSSGWIIRVFCLGFFPYTTTKICEYIIWGRGQFGTLSFLQTLESLFRPIAVVGLFLVAGFPGVVAAFVLVEVVVAAAHVFCIRDLFGGERPARYPSSQLIREAFPCYLEGWLWRLRADGDNWVVGILLGPSALAIYYVAGIMVSQTTLLFTAVDRVVVERLGRHLAKPESLSEKTLALHSTVSRFMLPVLLWLLAMTPLAIVVIGGQGYSSAVLPALVLMLVAIARFLFMPIDRSVFVGTPPRYRLYKTTVEAATFFGAAVVMVPLAGLSGVAAAKLAGQVAGGGFGLAILRQMLRLKLPFAEAARAVLTAGPGTALVLWFMPQAGNSIEAVSIAAVASTVWLVSFLVLVALFDRPYLAAFAAEVRRAIGRQSNATS